MSDRQHIDAAVRERALRDSAFRARLIADPSAAVADALGVEIPAGISIRVVEERPGEVVVVVPPASVAEGELTDAELQEAVGGWHPSGGTQVNVCSVIC